MGAGIQCWDATGKLVADVGDYNCRFIGSINVSMPGNTPVVTAGFNGITAAGSFAVIVSSSTTIRTPGTFTCRTYDGGIRLFSLLKSAAAATLTIHVYGFL